MGIRYNQKFPHILFLFIIFEHMCLATFTNESNPHLNAVQLMVSKVLIFHENTEILPSVDFCYLYPGNNDPTEHINLVLFGITVINQPDWVEMAK